LFEKYSHFFFLLVNLINLKKHKSINIFYIILFCFVFTFQILIIIIIITLKFFTKDNPIASDNNYRSEIVMRLPNLKILDKDEITSDDIDAAEEVRIIIIINYL